MSVIFPAAAAARLDDKQQRAKRSNGDGPPRRGSAMRIILSAFPLFIIPVGIYCLIAFTTTGDPVPLTHGGVELTANASPLMGILGQKFFSIGMIGGEVEWVLTKGDALLVLSIAVLFMEILKSTSTGTATIMNHALSMIVFIVCLMLFLLNPNFATSVFFILTVMALLDVLAGVVVTIVSARRDFGVSEGFVG
ncbi:MAG: hypothetical protein VXW22_04180 [Pseudomonadota bacterium]|jgi:hypothetical protein|nr:hypothetical protein [Pseudomonadota bacterium]